MDFDKRAFDRALDDAGQELIREASRTLQAENNRYLNGLSRRLRGQPLEEIKAELQRHYGSGRDGIKDPDLTNWAEGIHEGRHFNVTVTVK